MKFPESSDLIRRYSGTGFLGKRVQSTLLATDSSPSLLPIFTKCRKDLSVRLLSILYVHSGPIDTFASVAPGWRDTEEMQIHASKRWEMNK